MSEDKARQMAEEVIELFRNTHFDTKHANEIICRSVAVSLAYLDQCKIIDRLPKTADGVPVYEGSTVWAKTPKGVVEARVDDPGEWDWWDEDEELCVFCTHVYGGTSLKGCYSTRALAEAALNQETTS